jgi:hypothetical protein
MDTQFSEEPIRALPELAQVSNAFVVNRTLDVTQKDGRFGEWVLSSRSIPSIDPCCRAGRTSRRYGTSGLRRTFAATASVQHSFRPQRRGPQRGDADSSRSKPRTTMSSPAVSSPSPASGRGELPLEKGDDEASDVRFDGRGTQPEKFNWRPVVPTGS